MDWSGRVSISWVQKWLISYSTTSKSEREWRSERWTLLAFISIQWTLIPSDFFIRYCRKYFVAFPLSKCFILEMGFVYKFSFSEIPLSYDNYFSLDWKAKSCFWESKTRYFKSTKMVRPLNNKKIVKKRTKKFIRHQSVDFLRVKPNWRKPKVNNGCLPFSICLLTCFASSRIREPVNTIGT